MPRRIDNINHGFVSQSMGDIYGCLIDKMDDLGGRAAHDKTSHNYSRIRIIVVVVSSIVDTKNSLIWWGISMLK